MTEREWKRIETLRREIVAAQDSVQLDTMPPMDRAIIRLLACQAVALEMMAEWAISSKIGEPRQATRVRPEPPESDP